jgi:hypothetical protein
MRFAARHVGSGDWGIWDGGVVSWRATDLAEDEAHQQAADLNIIYHQYGQREQKDRREVTPPIQMSSAAWAAAGHSITGSKSDKSGGAECAVQTDIKCGSKLLTFVR